MHLTAFMYIIFGFQFILIDWYTQVGFSYVILLESTGTGYILHTRGWRSVYLYPKTPCFLGCAPTDIKEGMIQLVKWLSELLLLGFSKYSPFTHGFLSMSIMHSFTYCFLTMSSLYAIFFILYGIVPQLCLLKGIPVFPKVLYCLILACNVMKITFAVT